MHAGEAASSTEDEGANQAERRAMGEGMLLISLADASMVDSFCAFLSRVNVQVDGVDGAVVSASVPGAHSDLHERREIHGYVVTWNALNPGRDATLLD
jgi:hypothetical protein